MAVINFAQLLEDCTPFTDEAKTVIDLLSDETGGAPPIPSQPAHHGTLITAPSPKDRVAHGKHLYIRLFHHVTLSAMHLPDAQVADLTSDIDFLIFLHLLHDIPSSAGIGATSLYAAGTTSFIFKVQTAWHGPCILKTVQAPYLRNRQVRDATASYKDRYGSHTEFSPRIHISNPGWLLMEFIDGPTLAAHIDQIRASSTFLSDDYFDKFASIFAHLTEALAYYEMQTPPIPHGDLTPYNIIVQPTRIVLIDFGPNYVLQGRVVIQERFIEAFERTALFTAPEVLTSKSSPVVKSDIYSLGIIALELTSQESLKRELIGRRMNRIWEQASTLGIAQVVEDMIDAAPANRLLLIGDHASSSLYKTVNGIIQDKIAAYRRIALDNMPAERKRYIVPDVWNAIRLSWQLWRTKDARYTRIGKSLIFAALLNALLQTVIVFSFLAWTALDAKLQWFSNVELPLSGGILLWVEKLPRDFVAGEFWHNLPGRLVALSFGLVAGRYYANIFALLKLEGGPALLAKQVSLWTRLNAVSYFVPIMAAIVWNPRWWPWCALVGALVPAINNYLCYWAASHAAAVGKAFSAEKEFYDSERFLTYFNEWWALMGGYSVAIGVIGVLLQAGWAKDEPVYAAVVCFINMFKMYWINCGVYAPDVRGNLARLFFTLRRHDKIRFAASAKALDKTDAAPPDFLFG